MPLLINSNLQFSPPPLPFYFYLRFHFVFGLILVFIYFHLLFWLVLLVGNFFLIGPATIMANCAVED